MKMSNAPRCALVAVVTLLLCGLMTPLASAVDAIVSVPVATVWSGPDKPRPEDTKLLFGYPYAYAEWVGKLSAEDRLAQVGRIETQALLGDRVQILEIEGEWRKVAIPSQPRTPGDREGYQGWIHALHLRPAEDDEVVDPAEVAIVVSPTAALVRPKQPERNALLPEGVFMEDENGQLTRDLHMPATPSGVLHHVSFDTTLQVVSRSYKWVRVVLEPQGETLKIAAKDVEVHKGMEAPRHSPERVLELAKRFLGLPYLWGGTSGFGYDCSGFIYALFHSQGVTIPRDSGPQYEAGQPVELKDLQPGDAVFFAKDGKPPHHVGLYIGDNQMIDSPNSKGAVRILSLSTAPYAEQLVGGRRYIPPVD